MNRDYPNFGRDTKPQIEWQQWWRKLIAGECLAVLAECLSSTQPDQAPGDKQFSLFQSAINR